MKPACALLLLLSGMTAAHPVDEMVQGAYLTLAPGVVQLELDLTPGSAVAATLLKALDANGDRQISPAEGRIFAKQVLGQSTLTLNGVAAPWTLDLVSVPPYQNLLTGNDVLKIYATAKRLDRVGAGTLTYQNRYQPVKSQWMANIFLLPGKGWQYQVAGQTHTNDGRGFTVAYRVLHP
ncbi:hypothetical protein [Deinococcus ruber]|uniref:EF-hand domain-containing protein n=1 Tax=Deinococcus ruber TaxID=1848197 RepID=A0A918KVW4_9DEIO|nr:hypothetical protein [Deinococcus ruber]GGR36530.1 hypothetical protein GCM10008957_52760 [Deinococcus ruber]